MTLGEIIRYTDRIKPNAFSAEEKIVWINELEHEIQADVFGVKDPDGFDSHGTAAGWEDEEMYIPEAFHRVYYTYLEARIEAANGEWSEYANAIQLYNAFRGEFERWYARNFVDEK